MTVIDVGAGTELRHVRIQAESAEAVHLGITRVRLADSATYDGFALIAGARLSRQDIHAAIEGESANFILNGAYLLCGDQDATVSANVDHQAKNGRTSELVKGVLSDRAHGAFLGSVLARDRADGTDARQLNRNLMLSAAARIDTKPELFIHADEVKCGHGATIGSLDQTQYFYLLARRIDPATARHMLVGAFAADVFDMAALPAAIDAHARRYFEAWLARGDSP